MKTLYYYRILAAICILSHAVANGALVNYYPLDGSINDTQSGLNGTVNGTGYQYVSGAFGGSQALECDYATYVSTSPANFIGAGDTFSLAFFVKSTAGSDAGYQVNCGLMNLGGYGGAILTEFKTHQGAGGESNFAFGNSAGLWFTGTTIPDGAWRHVAFTHDGTTTKLYIDGSYIEESTTPNITGATYPLTFGGQGGWSTGDSTGYRIAMDDVRTYNSALTAGEVLALATIPEPAGILVLCGFFGGMLLRRK